MSNQPKFGLMDQGWAAPELDDAEAMQASLATIRLADELGFDSCWLGEHHHRRATAGFWGRIPASELVLAYAAAQTSRVALGTGVRILSTTPALRTAEEMCTLSVLSGGRVDFGIGLGSGQHGLKTREEKAAEFRRLLDELLSTLRNDPALNQPELSPVSPVDITTRLWAAARDILTLTHLAETGVNLVVGQAEVGEVQANYVRQYREAGGTGLTRGVRLVYVAPTMEQAMAESAAAAELYFSQMSQGGYIKEAIDKGILPAKPASHQAMLDQISFIVGTPDSVARQLNDYLDLTGIDQLDAMVQIPRLEPQHVHASMRLLQHEVRPQLIYGGMEIATPRRLALP